jgi:hypothetical protein
MYKVMPSHDLLQAQFADEGYMEIMLRTGGRSLQSWFSFSFLSSKLLSAWYQLVAGNCGLLQNHDLWFKDFANEVARVALLHTNYTGKAAI